ncbi:hypothetical protein AB9P05_13910 [Roseivirga sp. BDSF3-8]|uniref:hypothetical protein n=1 Tax=Roseivirga sp. BDSF3-8 TaxID=3241598 RepID=UPI003531DC24
MRFQKKFYTFKDLFVKGWVIGGTMLGAGYALCLYGFFCLVREGFMLTMFELRS